MKFWNDMKDAAGDLTNRILMLGNPDTGLPERISAKKFIESLRSLWISQQIGTATDKSPSERAISNLLAPKFNIVSNGAGFVDLDGWSMWGFEEGAATLSLKKDGDQPIISLAKFKVGDVALRQVTFKKFKFNLLKKYTLRTRVRASKSIRTNIKITNENGSDYVVLPVKSFDIGENWAELEVTFYPLTEGGSPTIIFTYTNITQNEVIEISHLSLRESIDSWDDCITTLYK